MFNDPIAPKSKKNEKQSPWDFRAPPYDERSSCYVNAGSHWGVGFTNPVGHVGNAKMRIPTLPYGKPETLQVAEVPRKNLEQYFLE